MALARWEPFALDLPDRWKWLFDIEAGTDNWLRFEEIHEDGTLVVRAELPGVDPTRMWTCRFRTACCTLEPPAVRSRRAKTRSPTAQSSGTVRSAVTWHCPKGLTKRGEGRIQGWDSRSQDSVAREKGVTSREVSPSAKNKKTTSHSIATSSCLPPGRRRWPLRGTRRTNVRPCGDVLIDVPSVRQGGPARSRPSRRLDSRYRGCRAVFRLGAAG